MLDKKQLGAKRGNEDTQYFSMQHKCNNSTCCMSHVVELIVELYVECKNSCEGQDIKLNAQHIA